MLSLATLTQNSSSSSSDDNDSSNDDDDDNNNMLSNLEEYVLVLTIWIGITVSSVFPYENVLKSNY
jgi:hypothetical protein